VRIEYSSNNSGGRWWLTDDHWKALEAAGWKVDWFAQQTDRVFRTVGDDGRWLGALASSAEKDFETPADAMREFERITGQDVMNEGCNCCGAPHCFSWGEDTASEYVSGTDCGAYLFPGAPASLREALEQRSKG
jgi:hypothetical protein